MVDEEEDDEDKIESPEELLALLMSEEKALARIVDSPDPRRIATFLEGTMFPILRDTLRAMAVQADAIEELEDSVYVRSTIQTSDAAKIHAFLDKSLSFFESAKEMLPLSERDAYGAMLGEVRRLVIRAEEDTPESDDEDDDPDAAAIRNAPEIQPS